MEAIMARVITQETQVVASSGDSLVAEMAAAVVTAAAMVEEEEVVAAAEMVAEVEAAEGVDFHAESVDCIYYSTCMVHSVLQQLASNSTSRATPTASSAFRHHH